jgi:Ca2+-binding RTX toxin-like protein
VAIQSIYGAASTRTGDNVYGFNATDGAPFDWSNLPGGVPSLTIYDSGGIDTINASNYADHQVINLEPGIGAFTFSSIGGQLRNISIAQGTIIENAVGGSGNDTIGGNGVANIISGNAGNDLLIGGGHNDRLYGNADSDTLEGGAGADILSGGAGRDRAVYDASSAGVTINLQTGHGTGGEAQGDRLFSIGDIDGSRFRDFITGSDLANDIYTGGSNDVIDGAGGNDTLDGGVGADVLSGGMGDDNYAVDNVGDTVNENAGAGTGIDTVNIYVRLTSYELTAEVENLLYFGNQDFHATGNGLANVITGSRASDIIDGLGGNDTLDGGLDAGVADLLRGGAGNDLYIYRGADNIEELAGEGLRDEVHSSVSYTLTDNVEILRLIGNAVTNGTGNAGANEIIGNARQNIITGGLGGDTLTGGAQADDFRFLSIADSAVTDGFRDLIMDFEAGIDDIDLSVIDANGAAAGDAAFVFRPGNGAAFTGGLGQVRWFQIDRVGGTNDVTMVEGDINGDRVADFQIELAGLKVLAAGDFIL